MANTISIRLGLEGAVELKQQLESAGVTGGAAFDKLRSGLERLSALDTGAAVQAIQRVTQAYQQAQQAAGQAAANSFAGVGAAADYKARAADVAAYGSQLDALRSKFNPLFAASKQYEGVLDEISAAEKVGAISANEAAAARTNATAAYAKANAPLVANTAAHGANATAAKAGAQVLRDFALQGQDLFVQLQAGGSVMTAFTQQGSQIAQQMLASGYGVSALKSAVGLLLSPMALAIGSVVALVGGLGVLTVASNSSVGQFNAVKVALRGTHDDFSTLAQTVEDVAKRVSATSGLGFSEALETAKTIASGRYFAGTAQDLERLTRDAADLGAIMGGGAAQGTKILSDAAGGVSKAAQDLSEKFSTSLTPAVLKQIEALERSGKSSQAYELLLTSLESKMKGAAQDSLSPLGKAWTDLGNAFTDSTKGWQPFLEWLSTSGAAAIDKVAKSISGARDSLKSLADQQVAAQNQAQIDIYNQTRPSGSNFVVAATPSGLSKDAFVQNWLEAAKAAGQQLGVSPQTILGQFGNETGWGKSLYGNNPGNIKAGQGYTGSVYVNPGDGQTYRAYANPQDFVSDFVALIKQKYPDALNKGDNAAAYASGLHYGQQGGYAEDPDYGKKLTASAASVSGAFNPAATVALPTVAVTASTTGSGGILDPKKAIDDANAVVKSLNLVGDTRQELQQKIAALNAAQKLPDATQDEINHYKDGVVILTGRLNEALTPAEAFIQSLKDQQGATAAVTEGDKVLIDVRQRIAEIERSGGQFTEAQKRQAEALAIENSSNQLKGLSAQMVLQAANSNELAAAYGQGGDAVLAVTAKQSAYQALLKAYPHDSAAIQAALPDLTQKFYDVAKSAQAAQLAQQTQGIEDNIKLVQAQTATLGQNEDQRNRTLAVLQTEIGFHLKEGEALSAEQQHLLDAIGTQADYQASLKRQQTALAEIGSFFDSTFSTISDAIVGAFATGEQSAVKFKDVVASVEKAIEAEFLKLALINPLKNWLTGSTSSSSPTLFSVLGRLFGSTDSTTTSGIGSVATGSGVSALESLGFFNPISGDSPSTIASNANSGLGSLDSVGTVGVLAKGLDWLTGGNLITKIGDGIKSALGFTSGETVGSWVSGLIGESTGGVAGGATGALGGAASAEAGGLVAGSAADAGASGLGANIGIVGTAVDKIADALPYIGVAISLITDFAQGNYRGAGLVAGGAATGALAGTFLFPGLGTAAGAAIGATLGGLIDAFLPTHPLHPFQDTEVDVKGGLLTAGKSVSQLEDASTTASGVQSWADNLNTYFDKVGVRLTNLDSAIGHIGENVTGLAQTTDPNTLFSKLQFDNATNDRSNFSVAKSALVGMSFNTPEDFVTELSKIAGFADAASALGIQLKGVGQDITNITIDSVKQGIDQSKAFVQDAQGNDVQYTNDLRTALGNDLPGKVFSSVQALDDEIASVNTFVQQTLPQMLTPTRVTQSSVQDSIQASNQRYADAIARDQQLGLGNTAALEGARDQAIAILMKPALDAINASLTSIVGRGQTLLYGQAGSGQATLANLAVSQDNERSQLYDQIHQAFGDNQVATDNYNRALQSLLVTQQAETVATQQQVRLSQEQSAASLAASISSYATRAGINDLGWQLAAYDAKAAEERDEFIKSWTDYYGQASTQTADFQAELLVVDKAHAAERLEIEKTYAGQSTAVLQQAQSNVVSLFGSIKDYAAGLATSDLSPLSPAAQYDYAASQFKQIAGQALAGDYTAASQLTSVSDTFLKASEAMYDHGAQYAADYQSVVDALSGISSVSDMLTASDMRQISQDSTTTITSAISSLQDEMAAVRRELQQQTRALAA